MNRRIQSICGSIFAFVFLIGLFMINTAKGRLGTVGFIGYSLSALAVLAELCTVIAGIVLKMETKKNEK